MGLAFDISEAVIHVPLAREAFGKRVWFEHVAILFRGVGSDKFTKQERGLFFGKEPVALTQTLKNL